MKERDRKCGKVLVAGDAMLDRYHFGTVERISPEAPVPVFLQTGKETYTPGGAANVAVNLAAAGVQAEFCSIVGEDACGKILLERLKGDGVGTGYVAVTPERRTTLKLRYIGQGNQQILRVDEEDLSDVGVELVKDRLEALQEEISDFSVVVLSDYRKGFLTAALTRRLISMAGENGIPVLVDVKDPDYTKYADAFVLKPNRKELGMLTGRGTGNREEVIAAAVELCRNAPSAYVLTTLGADGMVLVDKSGLVREVKSTASEVYDVTGAGDTSIAYLAAEMARGSSVEDAMVVANYAAGIQVSKVGTGVVYPDEVSAVMNRNKAWEKHPEDGGDDELCALRQAKRSGKKIVFTNGCFDILHAGHISYLKRARQLGDILVVGLNSDASVKRLKGRERPVNPLDDRMLLLSALECVDYVIPFEEDTPARLIEQVVPDVLVKGGDYRIEDIVGGEFVRKNGGEVMVLPFVEGRSTTAVIRKIQGGE